MTVFPLEPQIERDRWGRPMVVPPEGGKATAYTRCTTYVGCLDDTYKLGQWQQRHVVMGTALHDDLIAAVRDTHPDDRDTLDRLVDEAKERSGAGDAARLGTYLHAVTEAADRGTDPAAVQPPMQSTGPLNPADYVADLRAYEQATAPFKALHIEKFVVQDDLKVGGTPDRIVEFEGRNYIADLKTGSVEWGGLKIAMQLAMYAHSRLYDVRTHQRGDLPDVDLKRGIVIHLPAGTGKASLLWVDIAAGWDAVRVARDVREWRNRGRRVFTPLDVQGDLVADLARTELEMKVRGANSVETLTALWAKHANVWDDDLTAMATARKQVLTRHLTEAG